MAKTFEIFKDARFRIIHLGIYLKSPRPIEWNALEFCGENEYFKEMLLKTHSFDMEWNDRENSFNFIWKEMIFEMSKTHHNFTETISHQLHMPLLPTKCSERTHYTQLSSCKHPSQAKPSKFNWKQIKCVSYFPI